MNDPGGDNGPSSQLRRLDGFPSLAHFISKDIDAAIFHAFDELAARNLLYLQSNLNELNIQLRKLDDEDAKNGPGNPRVRCSAREYRSLKAAADQAGELDVNDGAARQRGFTNLESNNSSLETERRENDSKYFSDRVELHNKIKHAMREYREALIQEQQVKSFKRPHKRSLSNFKRYFARKDGNILLGDDENLLDEPRDLVALSPLEDDRLNSFLRYTCGYCFRDRKRRPIPDLDIFYYSERAIQLTGYTIATILCGILLLGAMACLSLVYNRPWRLRLGMVALFTSLFAIVVGLLTNARRSEVFGSTAAYAAVLVVYVSGSLGPPNRSSM